MKRRWCFVLAISLPTSVFAEEAALNGMEAIVESMRTDFPHLELQMNPETGLPMSLQNLDQPRPGLTIPEQATPEETVREFFEGRGARLFGFDSEAAQVEILRSVPDPQIDGLWTVRAEQRFNGLPVFGAQAVASVRQGFGIASIESSFVPKPAPSPEPALRWHEAAKRALDAYSKLMEDEDVIPDPPASDGSPPSVEARLAYFNPSNWQESEPAGRLGRMFGIESEVEDSLVLVWQVRVGTYLFFVDTQEGEILWRYRDLRTVRNRQTFDSEGRATLPGTLVITEVGPEPGQVPHADADAAHRHAASAYDYFRRTFQRDSFDDNDGAGPSGGAAISSSVRYGVAPVAQWDHLAKRLLYGLGYAEHLDVVGHEFTHAVSQHEAGFVYANQPGALDEFIADFFGIVIEGAVTSLDWRLGEGLPSERDMENPHRAGFDRSKRYNRVTNNGQPEHMDEFVKPKDEICKSTTDRDNGCVHFNSGILNKAAHLAAVGGSHRGNAVQPIGIPKLEQILYRALSRKLVSDSRFADLRRLSGQSCRDLVTNGLYAVEAQDCDRLDTAYQAVGIP